MQYTGTTFLKYGWWLVLTLAAGLQGCATPQAVKPVATQNKQNIEALSQNVGVLAALYGPLLRSSGDALIYNRIGQILDEWIQVTGSASEEEPEYPDWETAFTSLGGPMEKRYRYVRSALERGITPTAAVSSTPLNVVLPGGTGVSVVPSPAFNNISNGGASNIDAEATRLQHSEGWVYTAAVDSRFTPQVAHQLVRSLAELKKNQGGTNEVYFRTAEARMLPYDPALAYYREAVNGANQLFEALKQELATQLSTATVHSYALLDYAETRTDFTQSLLNIDRNDINTVLTSLGNRYISNANRRDAALQLFNSGLEKLMANP